MAWIASALVVVLMVWVGQGLPEGSTPMDAYPSLVAGELWLGGDKEAIYGASAFREPDGRWAEAMARVGAEDSKTAYVYAPGLVLVFAALRVIGVDAAQLGLLLLLLNAVSVVVLAHAVQQGGRYRAAWLPVIAAALALPTVTVQSARLGQNTLMMGALFVLLLPRRGPWWSACSGALLGHLKPWSPVLVVGYLYERRWRDAAAFLAGNGLGVLLGSLLAGPSLLVQYAELVTTLTRHTVTRVTNLSVHSFLTRLTDPGWVSGARAFDEIEIGLWIRLLGAVAAAAFMLVGARAARASKASVVALAVSLFVPSVVWLHYSCLALPFLVHQVLEGRPRVRFVALLAYAWLAWPAQRVWKFHRVLPPEVMVFVIFAPAVCVLLALVAAAWRPDEASPHRAARPTAHDP